MSCRCTEYYGEVILVKILIVGAGLIAYGCAYSALKEGNKVFVADHSTEFGLPNVWPSLLHDRNNIPLNFETEQGFEGKDSGFRHEWIMKSMNIQLAKQGVVLLNKVRIVSSAKLPSGFNVHLKGASQMDGKHMFDMVIDTTKDTWIPWAKQHNLTDVSICYEIERKPATGFLHIDTEAGNFSDAQLQLERYDGLIESWYSEQKESSNSKILEIMSTNLPVDQNMWSCEQRFLNGMNLWDNLMEMNL